MDAVLNNKSQVLVEAFEQLKAKVAPVIVATEQRAASAVCVEVDAESSQDDEKGAKGES